MKTLDIIKPIRGTLKNSALAAAMACCLVTQAQAATIPVPNGSFETLYKPGSTIITADVPTDSWTQGAGPDAAIEGGFGLATFSDATTGAAVDIPGWVNAPAAGAPPDGGWAPPYGWPKGSGVVSRGGTSYGSYEYSGNPSEWGNPYGAAIESAAPLATVATGRTYTISMSSNNALSPAVLDLLANGVILTPTSSGTAPDGSWTLRTKTYAAASLAGVVGQPLTIRVGWAVGAGGSDQGHLDNVQLADDLVTDLTPPTLTSFVDNKAGGPVAANEAVTYTVTFSEPMNGGTVNSADFSNAGATAMTVNSVTQTVDPAVFLVIATPTAPGTLQLQITAGATLTGSDGNALVTTSAIADETIITVNPVAAPVNDNFAAAIDLTGAESGQTGDIVTGTQSGTTNVGATLESGEPNTGGGTDTVWFKWTCPSGGGELTFSTLGSAYVGREWDAVVGLYTGASAGALTSIGGPQDGDYHEIMTRPVVGGTTYYIQVAGYANEPTTNILLTWNFVETVYEAKILTMGPGIANISEVFANEATIGLSYPYGANKATLAPTFTLSPGATCDRTSGVIPSPNFSAGDVTYTVTSAGASPTVNVYTVTAIEDPVSSASDIISFGPNAVISGNDITWYAPGGSDLSALNPTYTVSPFATGSPASGAAVDFSTTNPQTYTITAQDLSTQEYFVTAIVAPAESTVLWNLTGGGDWNLNTVNWLGQSSSSPTPFFNGYNVIFDKTNGGTISIAPNMLPLSTTVSAASGTYTFTGNPITSGSLTKSGGGTLQLNVAPANFSNIAVNGGTLFLFAAESGFSPNGAPFTIPNVTVESGATLKGWRARAAGGTLTLNGGRYWEDNGWNDGGWNGPVVLATDSFFGLNGTCYNQTIAGQISGPGGFTFSTTNGAVLTLNTSNIYTGPTIVTGGTVNCNDVDALGSGALTVNSGGAKVNLNYSGNKSIAGLTLGGLPQASGTHGSTASPATYKNDTYFSGTGTVTVPASSAKNMLTFSFGVLGAATIGDTTITLEVPFGTDRTNLAPTYTVSLGAIGSPVSGTPRNFTGAQIYTVTAEDLSTKNYTVTVTEAVLPDIFTWANAASGDWSVAANWTNEELIVATPLAGGRESYTLNFNVAGTYTATNNLSSGFELNQLNLGATVSLAGNGLALVANGPTPPAMSQNSGSLVDITNALALDANTTFGGTGGGQVNLRGLISGAGSLTKNGSGTLRIYNVSNSFVGGTIINTGTLFGDIDAKVGTGPITLNGGVLYMWRFKPTNALIVNGGTLTSENGFNQNLLAGPITLNTTLICNAPYQLTCSNTISGVGGLTKNSDGLMILSATSTSTYTGPTSVTAGILRLDSTNALSGSSALSISGSGVMNLNYAGTKTVASLTLGGVAQTTPGTYGSTASGAANPNDTYFAGSGTVTVTGASGFTTWADANAGGQSADQDYDNDGVDNGIEYFMGQTGSSFTAMPGLDGTNTVTWPMVAGYDGTYEVQTSPDLATWTNVEPRPTPSGGNLSYLLPPGSGKQFVRLLVTPTP